MNKKKQLGQYFTPRFVADFMVSLSNASKIGKILEPASGEGVFLDSLKAAGYVNVDGYEIDATLSNDGKHPVVYESFVSAEANPPYDLVIGNPPYVRWKNMSAQQKEELGLSPLWAHYFNSLGDYLYLFILKSVELLKDGGELIFITPEYWMNTMHAQTLRNYLLQHGHIEQIFHFSETPIFDKVASSIIIFKYVKKASSAPTKVYKYNSKKRLTSQDLVSYRDNERWEQFEIKKFSKNDNWILAPDDVRRKLELYESKCRANYEDFHQLSLIPEEEVNYVRLGDIANIANGLVSGLDKAFRIEEGAILNDAEQKATASVIKAKDMTSLYNKTLSRYIFLNDLELTESQLRTQYPAFYAQLQPFKDDLNKRYSYNRDVHYWDWIFLRSYTHFKKPVAKIFVPCKERITNKDRLRFCYAASGVLPTQDVTAIYLDPKVKEDIYYILALLNSKVTYEWVKHKGLIKGGIAEFSERPLASIPIRLIDWKNEKEVELYETITRLTKASVESKTLDPQIDSLIDQLLN